jgi:lipoprotein NlpI
MVHKYVIVSVQQVFNQLITVSKYSLPIQHEVILKKMADVLPVHLTINVENTLFILHILENNYRFVKLECSTLELVNYEQIKNHHINSNQK